MKLKIKKKNLENIVESGKVKVNVMKRTTGFSTEMHCDKTGRRVIRKILRDMVMMRLRKHKDGKESSYRWVTSRQRGKSG